MEHLNSNSQGWGHQYTPAQGSSYQRPNDGSAVGAYQQYGGTPQYQGHFQTQPQMMPQQHQWPITPSQNQQPQWNQAQQYAVPTTGAEQQQTTTTTHVTQDVQTYHQTGMQGKSYQQAPVQPKIDYEALKVAAPLPLTPSVPLSSGQSTTTTIRQELRSYQGSDTGGKAFRKAQKQNTVREFEARVQQMIIWLGGCPMRFPWYKNKNGYICAGGNHAITHEEIDKWLQNPSYSSEIGLVNTFFTPGERRLPDGRPLYVQAWHPPPVDLWQPMHRKHEEFCRLAIAAGYGPGHPGRCECFAGMPLPPITDRPAFGHRGPRLSGFDFGGGIGRMGW